MRLDLVEQARRGDRDATSAASARSRIPSDTSRDLPNAAACAAYDRQLSSARSSEPGRWPRSRQPGITG
jgi:hypothetical protein